MAAAWMVFSGNTVFSEKDRILYIKKGTDLPRLERQLIGGGFMTRHRTFRLLARVKGFTDNIQPGRYRVAAGASPWQLIGQLQSGIQTPVNLVIGKLHTREELLLKLAANIEAPAEAIRQYLYNADTLQQWGVDSNTLLTLLIPGTYPVTWNAPVTEVFSVLTKAGRSFWTNERIEKARRLGLSSTQVYTLASIVEEETNKEEDKGPIASVYLNRLRKGMRLGADPTIKFALRDFELRRIYHKHLSVASPFNTYLNTGLPPGPICIPGTGTIDAVLNAPATNYLFFVAKPELNGYSNFAETYEEHLGYAKAYQNELDRIMKSKK
jgi:UPF0755 protein